MAILGFVTSALLVFLLVAEKPWRLQVPEGLAGKSPGLEYFITAGRWWGALAGCTGCVLVLILQGWWSPPRAAIYPDSKPLSSQAAKWTLVFALASMAVAAGPRYQRLDLSLGNEEAFQLRHFVWGAYHPDAEGILKFDPVPWSEILPFNKGGNHPLWSSLEGRLGHILSGNDWSQTSTFSERGLRLFPWISGVLTTGLVVLLGGALGSPRAGLAAGLILALHPWHVRWSTEAEGYSTMLLGITAGFFCLVRAFQTNHWRWWMGFAAAQGLFLLCSAASGYVAAAQNLMALGCMARSPVPKTVRAGSAARLIAAGVIPLIPAALLLGPSVLQMAAHLKNAHGDVSVDPEWLVNGWTHLAGGVARHGEDPALSAGMGLNDVIARWPWRGWMILGGIPLIVTAGLFFLLRQDWRTRLVAGTLLLAGALAMIHITVFKTAFAIWDLHFAVLVFVLAVAWAGKGLMKLNPRSLASLPLLLAMLCSMVSLPALSKIISVPRQPLREVVAVMRGVSPALTQADPHGLTASFGAVAQEISVYDPRLRVLTSPEELNSLTEEAVKNQRPLFLCLRDRARLILEAPALLNAITDNPQWRRLPDIQGLEVRFTYEVYRWAPDEIQRLQLKR